MPALPPIADWTRWKATWPVGQKKATGSPQEYPCTALDGLTVTEWGRLGGWLRPTTDGAAVVFRAPVNGVTTSGSKYPRCELRELNPDGSLAAWSSSTGWHQLTVEMAFTALPRDKPHLVGAQIHDGKDDITVIRLEDTKLWVTRGDKKHTLITDAYRLGTRFTASLVVWQDVVTVFHDGRLVVELSAKFGRAFYKTGAYVQANCSNSKPCSVSNYGETVLYRVTVEHADKPPVASPPVPPVVAPDPPTCDPLPQPPAGAVEWWKKLLDRFGRR